MKYTLLFCLAFTLQILGQTPTNVEGSSYQFTKIYHLDATPVQSQGKTGTCWSFSGLSFFESELIRKGGKADPLSEMFVVRKSYENKADKFIRMDGKSISEKVELSMIFPGLSKTTGLFLMKYTAD